MSIPAQHPPTAELNAMTTHELVYEVAMYDVYCEYGESDFHSAAASARIHQAKSELARRFPKGWAVTGKRAGGD